MKQKPSTELSIDVYAVIRRAVEEGAAIGWRRAHKHTETPDKDSAAQTIADEIMASLSDVVKWPEV